MKKILAVVLLVCVLFSLSGCGKKAYEYKDSEFSSNGITITLTKAFKGKNHTGYAACYDSKDVAVFVIKENYTLNADFKDMTLDQYAESIYSVNSERNPSPITKTEGITYIEYEFANEDGAVIYKYFVAMYKGDEAFWLVQFACNVDVYGEYLPYFVKWAKTVNVSAQVVDGGDNQREQV